MVFDAAAKMGETSLNKCLLKGPQEYKPLPEVLFNFRFGAIAVCADIREMFHQVLIKPEDRAAQRFLWRNFDGTRPPDVYEMRVMTFGAACSPCIAQYVKTINALQHVQHDPRAVEAILYHHYVDDYVDSFQSEEQAIEISRQVVAIHKDAGFDLRGFASNSPVVMRKLGAGENVSLLLSKNENGLATEKVLGMYWDPGNDVFRYKLKLHRVDTEIIGNKRLPTKRELLSIVMSVFDPMGFLSHLLIAAKLLMREIWRSNVSWDEAIPEGLGRAWQMWFENLKKAEMLSIPRCYFSHTVAEQLELHIFVDASEDACAVAAYLRDTTSKTLAFVCARTKCAPIKTLSIPRLELQAAVMGSRMKLTILNSNTFGILNCTLWSDSKTVIKWIKSPARRFKPFVSHRITEILTNTSAEEWKWLPTEENVADELMGQLPKDRLTPYVRPFCFTGLDYFGPVTVAIGRRTEKRWVALFTCLTLRAIHLEIARDLSTDACILVMRNFINRRGTPQRIRSDNGKSFVGLANDPRSFVETFECERIQSELSNKGVEWIFNCPRNPSEGGVWERMIRSVKRVLHQTLKETTPQEHTFNSFLIEAENIINSRPLTHIPISIDDEEPLTPNHFLIGYNNASRIQVSEEGLRANDALRKQWRILKQMKEHFWKRWIFEYLPTLTRRAKWCERSEPLKINDLVFVCDESVPRQQWSRGKVVKLYHGKDGVARRADVETKNGIMQRPVSRLAVLDVE